MNSTVSVYIQRFDASGRLQSKRTAPTARCASSIDCEIDSDLCRHGFCSLHCGLKRCRNFSGFKTARVETKVDDSVQAMVDDDNSAEAPIEESAESVYLARFQPGLLGVRALAFSTQSTQLLILLDSDNATWLHLGRLSVRFSE